MIMVWLAISGNTLYFSFLNDINWLWLWYRVCHISSKRVMSCDWACSHFEGSSNCWKKPSDTWGRKALNQRNLRQALERSLSQGSSQMPTIFDAVSVLGFVWRFALNWKHTWNTHNKSMNTIFFSFSKIFDIRPLANAIADGWSWDCLPVSVVVFMHSWSWHWPTMVLFNQPYTSFSQQLHTVMQQLPLYASFLSHKKIRSSTTPESLYDYHYLWNQSFKPSWISTKADFDIHRSRCPASTSWEPLACGEIWQQSAELAFREFSPNIGVSQEPQVEGQIRLFCMWI